MLKTLVCAVAFTLPVMAFSETPKMSNSTMVDSDGMTLYTFDKDTTPGKSACIGGCAKMWPAATAGANDRASGDWSFVPSADGGNQWTYKGHPLYRYAKDTNPGDMNGDGFKGMWHVARP